MYKKVLGAPHAQLRVRVLQDWERSARKFVVVTPTEYLRALRPRAIDREPESAHA